MREPALLSRRALAAALPLAALAAAPAVALPAIATADDAVLLDLGQRWAAAYDAMRAHDDEYDRIWQSMSSAAGREHEAVADRLFAAQDDLLHRILDMPARTMRGLAVKTEALACEHDVRDHGLAAIEAALADATDLQRRSSLSLAVDVLKLARTA